MSQPFPIHFVIGTGRCGSSLLHELICRHPDVRFVSNVDDRVPLGAVTRRWNNSTHRLLPASASRKGRVRFAPSEGYRALEREVSPLLSVPNRDLVASDATPWVSAKVTAFFGRRYDAVGSGTMVHKWTGWPRAGLMRAVFPDARFINVVRDGRAVANSWLQMPWWRGYEGPEHWQWGPLTSAEQRRWEKSDRSYPVLAALLWAKLVDAAQEAQSTLPEDAWLDVRYEDMMADPEGTVSKALAFFGIDPEGRSAAGVARYHFDPTRIQGFHADLGPAVVADVTDAMQEQLRYYGYLQD